MNKLLKASIAIAFLGTALTSAAQDHSQMHRQHNMANMTVAQDDSRQVVQMPAPMKQHMLANMRDHLGALSEILAAMAQGDYSKVADVSEKRLGMNSPSAAGCADEPNNSSSKMNAQNNMDHQMTEAMPEGMRKIGLNMHKAATDFSVEARKSSKSKNDKPALSALSKVTQQCAACHAVYKVNP